MSDPKLREPETADEWRCAHAAEAAACDLLRAERDRLRAERDAALARAVAAEDRLREAARTLIEAIGSVGPENAEGAALRTSVEIARLRAVIAESTKGRRNRPGGAPLTRTCPEIPACASCCRGKPCSYGGAQ
jgi:hypothetical protein